MFSAQKLMTRESDEAASQCGRTRKVQRGHVGCLAAGMMSDKSSDTNARYYDTRMPEPVVPTRGAPWFTRALWALALMMVVGLGYSFWRISAVASPRLDLPPGQTP